MEPMAFDSLPHRPFLAQRLDPRRFHFYRSTEYRIEMPLSLLLRAGFYELEKWHCPHRGSRLTAASAAAARRTHRRLGRQACGRMRVRSIVFVVMVPPISGPVALAPAAAATRACAPAPPPAKAEMPRSCQRRPAVSPVA